MHFRPLQYCGEGTLEEASRGGHLPEIMIRRYSRDTLLGISYLHENGIAHRDIKVDLVKVDEIN